MERMKLYIAIGMACREGKADTWTSVYEVCWSRFGGRPRGCHPYKGPHITQVKECIYEICVEAFWRHQLALRSEVVRRYIVRRATGVKSA